MDSIKKYLQEKGSALDNSEFDTDANWQEVKAKLRQKKSRLTPASAVSFAIASLQATLDRGFGAAQ